MLYGQARRLRKHMQAMDRSLVAVAKRFVVEDQAT